MADEEAGGLADENYGNGRKESGMVPGLTKS